MSISNAYAQQFGGAFAPESVSSAYQIFTNKNKFVGLLSASDITVQQALETLSYISASPTTINSKWNFANGNIVLPQAATLGTPCTEGQIGYDTDATSGQRIYACESGVWTLQGDAGSGGSGDSVTVNGTAVTDAALNESSPSIPSSGLGVKWQTTGSNPTKITAYAAVSTSSVLAGVLSDETGSGAAVFGTSPTITSPTVSTSIALPSDAVDAITEIASAIKTGADAKLVTGTAGGTGNCAQWNADGDIVDSGSGCGGGSGDSITINGSAVSDAAFNDGNPSTPSSGLSIKWQKDSSSPANISAYAAVSTSAVLAGVLSDETGTGVAVFGTSPTFTTSIETTNTFEAKSSGVSVINKPFNAGVVSTKITNGTSPSTTAAGMIGVDTSDIGQFVWASNSSVTRVTPGTFYGGIIIENLAAADDNITIPGYPWPVTIEKIWCECEGTCTTAATLSFEDDSANAMTLSGTPVCATGTTTPTAVDVSAGGSLTAFESWQFDVTNTPSPETDEYSVGWSYSIDRQ